tara:strand:+ start:478 stop:1062 length:585 start_codon:yes stop_codon:yes gene_type:complete
MIKLSGFNKIKTSVFISGKGSNLKNLFRFSLKKKSPIEIILVISNNSKAKGLIFAKRKNIKNKVFNFINKKEAENKVLKELKKEKIELICLAGFMKILSKNFIQKFKGKILNIHPSLLPKYKGLNTHLKAIKNKDKYSGCTVHLVNSKLDAGKIILQKKIKIKKKETPKSLSKRVLKEEHILYPKAIKKIYSNL